jgi:hypothetical protein
MDTRPGPRSDPWQTLKGRRSTSGCRACPTASHGSGCLPEGDTQHYRTLVALLANTRGEVVGELVGDGTGDETVVWPRVATEEFADSDAAWDEVVAAGLLTEAQAEAQRADGYQGMRIAMTLDGTWLSYSAGD